MIESLYLDEENFNSYCLYDGSRVLSKFSKVNIFIGSNNSGKSRFTRAFFSKNNELKFTLNKFDLQILNKLLEDLKSEITDFYDEYIIGDYGGILNILTTIEKIDFITEYFNINDIVLKGIYDVKNIKYSSYNTKKYITQGDIESKVQSIAVKYINEIQDKFSHLAKVRLDNIYFPTLRGLRKIYGTDDDLYLKTTKKDYFKLEDDALDNKIYTGVSLYEDLKKLLLGTKQERDRVREFEDFLSKNFFEGKDINVVPRINKEVVYVRIGDRDHSIYDLGDGIQSIIILTYPLFFYQGKKRYIFIEEPEHYLHPGFQRIFLETILHERFSNFQYFITTHSNHFLDITLDVDKVSVYTFKENEKIEGEPRFTIENVENEDSNILDIIGVRNSSVFLSNCTIWVEGITDRIYLRKYLDILQSEEDKQFKEDIHYSFVEYGGGNITHWSFLKDKDGNHPNIEVKRLCGKLFLISDKDGAGFKKNGSPGSKMERHKELKDTLRDRYYCLEAREMENIISSPILKKVIEDYEGDNTAKLKFNKNFSTKDHFKDSYLGTYIEKNIPDLSRKYAAESGTVNDKVNFAKRAVSFMQSENDLSEEAITLGKKLLDFIKDNNS
ncbi:ATP-dependent nuclease [Mucilaginibacter terrae]|uniref:ATP-dependent endonuclease of OLD family n=1 Tax=Mucilaginibacter terrae TaxID=1955052 RepID=A0ABU3GXS6_9SPHI|nr:ATP-binding protein [Mucilaginibacter terrae]MDT3404573.1 putative ATP-dependent endonuclease of OLD family [Mucilaginibacter terrae]